MTAPEYSPEHYGDLMYAAAAGDRSAARQLLTENWWPGDPDNSDAVDYMMRSAANILELPQPHIEPPAGRIPE